MSASKRARSSEYVGVPIWSLTSRSASYFSPRLSMVLMKFLPFMPNTHAMCTMKTSPACATQPARLPASSGNTRSAGHSPYSPASTALRPARRTIQLAAEFLTDPGDVLRTARVDGAHLLAVLLRPPPHPPPFMPHSGSPNPGSPRATCVQPPRHR